MCMARAGHVYRYVRNCDLKMAGNLSSNYQTLISLHNLSKDSFYYCDEIINVFRERMENTHPHARARAPS